MTHPAKPGPSQSFHKAAWSISNLDMTATLTPKYNFANAPQFFEREHSPASICQQGREDRPKVARAVQDVAKCLSRSWVLNAQDVD